MSASRSPSVMILPRAQSGSRRTLVWRRGAGALSEFQVRGLRQRMALKDQQLGAASRFSLPFPRARPTQRARSAATRTRRGAVAAVAMAGWFSLPLGGWRRAPRRIKQ